MSWNDLWSDVPPINLDQIDADPDALRCPVCCAEIVHYPTHDESDGVQTYAVPDVFVCEMSCGYQYSE